MIFAGILEEDFGQTSETMKNVAREGLNSDNNAVTMIQEILGASNYKRGTIAYTMKEVNFVDFIKEICNDFTKEIKIHDEVDGKKIKKYRVACQHCGLLLFEETYQ